MEYLRGCSSMAVAVLRSVRAKVRSRAACLILLLSVLVATLLRFSLLGNVFQSSDYAELPARVLVLPGYLWMLREPYGVLINLYVKLFAGLVSALGVNIDEFWWKAPTALAGTLQVPLTYAFLRRLKRSNRVSLFGSALVAVLPLHVMHSRYTYGYEILGVFFVTLAMWALLSFFERPSRRNGLRASLACGLYLTSHGYILPFIACVTAVAYTHARAGHDRLAPLHRLWRGVRLLGRELVWVFPGLFIPLYYASLRHTFGKSARLGFYVFDHLPGFLHSIGVPLALLFAFSVTGSLLVRTLRSRQAVLFALCGAAYLAPLFLGTPPGITVIGVYLLMGTYFWLLCTLVVVDSVLSRRKSFVTVLLGVSLVLTLYGTIESVFGLDGWADPTNVRCALGGVVPDPGSKAAGYFVRRYVSPTHTVLAVHEAVEPPVLVYYFGLYEHAYYDQSSEERAATYLEMRDSADVIICDTALLPQLEADGRFGERVEILSQGIPQMWIFARPGVGLPVLQVEASEVNASFDEEFSLRITLAPRRPGGVWQSGDH